MKLKLIPFVGKKDDEEEEKEVVDDSVKAEDKKNAEALRKQREELHAKIQHDDEKRTKILDKFKKIEKKSGQDAHFSECCLLLIEMVSEISNKYAFELKQLSDWVTEQTDGVEYMDIAQARKFFLKLRHQIKKRLEGIFGEFWVVNHVLSAMLFYINKWYAKGVTEKATDTVGSVLSAPVRGIKRLGQKAKVLNPDKKIRG